MTSSRASVPPHYLPLVPRSPSQRPPLLHIYLWLIQRAPTLWTNANGERSKKASSLILCQYIPVARTNANMQSGGQAPPPPKLGHYSHQHPPPLLPENSYILLAYLRNLFHSQSLSPSPQLSRNRNKSRWSGRAYAVPGAYVLVVDDTKAKMPQMSQE